MPQDFAGNLVVMLCIFARLNFILESSQNTKHKPKKTKIACIIQTNAS